MLLASPLGSRRAITEYTPAPDTNFHNITYHYVGIMYACIIRKEEHKIMEKNGIGQNTP